KVLYQDAVIAERTKKLEIAQTLPDFKVGYFNQSIIGFQNMGGNDVYYDAGQRFTGFNVGVSIPLTFFSNTAKIKSLELQKQSLEKTAENAKLQLQAQLQNTLQQYNQNLSRFTYYKTQALPNAALIISTAKLSFSSGGIGYVEYLQALQTATDVELNYLQSINQLNQSIININFLINRF
ncbi:MAG: TolC family protein, partial [Bacteroidota bacterium]